MIPIANVSHKILPDAPGINMPTTNEANMIFAPSRKKSERMFDLSFSNICHYIIIKRGHCQD